MHGVHDTHARRIRSMSKPYIQAHSRDARKRKVSSGPHYMHTRNVLRMVWRRLQVNAVETWRRYDFRKQKVLHALRLSSRTVAVGFVASACHRGRPHLCGGDTRTRTSDYYGS
eukprot:scaffold3717_cov37-Prasinocladus_malaysianus.AAC.1